MANINLLPWREELRRRKTQEFWALAGLVALGAGLVVGAGYLYAQFVVDAHRARVQFLKAQIQVLETKLQEIKDLEQRKADLLARMNVIQELQRSRPEIVHLFEELAKTVPDGLWLTAVEQKGRTLTIEGQAESNARVSSYMRNLEASPWLKDPKLVVIQADEKTRLSTFKLTVQQETPGQAEDEENAS
ncbi:MAG: pilus assembly protein PilN [Gammaproteobacteria bacterium]|nr:MAG: pilus assembly protein PilN [Gammaproteobacteria bacterium]